MENAKKNLVFHFGVGRHASFPQKFVVKSFLTIVFNKKIKNNLGIGAFGKRRKRSTNDPDIGPDKLAGGERNVLCVKEGCNC